MMIIGKLIVKDIGESTVSSVLRSSSFTDSGLRYTPSENIGVRSMSVNFEASDPLGSLEAAAFAILLHEAADALEVLRGTLKINHVELRKDQGPKNETIVQKKFGSTADDERMMLYGRDAGYLPAVVTVQEKLLRDRELTFNIFEKLACELEISETYDLLRNEINVIIESKEIEHNLEVNLKIWIDLADQLYKSQKTLEKDFETQKRKYLQEINKLSADTDTAYCNNIEKLDYISRTESSKIEQQSLQWSAIEQVLLEELSELDKTKRVDAKVSETLQTYGKSVTDDCEVEIGVWSNRYNAEVERRQQETTELEEKIEELKEFIEASHNLQQERNVFIDAYLEEQRQIQFEIDYSIAVNKAATLIQAIWRGYMVRHEIGRYSGIKQLLKRSPKKKKPKNKKK